MLVLALAVFAVTARFFGLQRGAVAGGVSLGTLVLASLVPLVPLGALIYLAHVVWVAGLWHFGKKVQRARATGPWQSASRWAKRGWSLWKW
ncbi:MAG: hypothetical protein IPL61_11260 [Myxococcales bacterium]|nr:hypothetical protein [Myxococcales bacterium]